LIDHLSRQSRLPIVRTAHLDFNGGSFSARRRKASRLLRLYSNAQWVITTRLHAALPCLAFGTPVLLLPTEYDPGRFTGNTQLVRSCTRSELMAGAADFDINDPPANWDLYLPYREALLAAVARFVED
jgi:hypothetical protein